MFIYVCNKVLTVEVIEVKPAGFAESENVVSCFYASGVVLFHCISVIDRTFISLQGNMI